MSNERVVIAILYSQIELLILNVYLQNIKKKIYFHLFQTIVRHHVQKTMF